MVQILTPWMTPVGPQLVYLDGNRSTVRPHLWVEENPTRSYAHYPLTIDGVGDPFYEV